MIGTADEPQARLLFPKLGMARVNGKLEAPPLLRCDHTYMCRSVCGNIQVLAGRFAGMRLGRHAPVVGQTDARQT